MYVYNVCMYVYRNDYIWTPRNSTETNGHEEDIALTTAAEHDIKLWWSQPLTTVVQLAYICFAKNIYRNG